MLASSNAAGCTLPGTPRRDWLLVPTASVRQGAVSAAGVLCGLLEVMGKPRHNAVIPLLLRFWEQEPVITASL